MMMMIVPNFIVLIVLAVAKVMIHIKQTKQFYIVV